jgi:hypothetical protein
VGDGEHHIHAFGHRLLRLGFEQTYPVQQ